MHRSLTFALLASLALSSCTSTKLTSVRSDTFDNRLDRIFVVTNFHPRLSTYEDAFGTEFSTLLAQAGVVSEVFKIPSTEGQELTLEQESNKAIEAMQEQASAFAAPLMLVINQTSAEIMSASWGTNKKYEFDASLYEVSSQERVWRASVTTKGEEYTSQSREARGMARKMVEKLDQDQLLPTPARGSVAGVQ